MKRIFNFSNQQQNAIRHEAHKFYKKTNRLLHKNNPIPKHIHSLPLCDGPYYLTKYNTKETNFSEGVVSLNDAVQSLVHLLQKRFDFDCFLNTVTPNSQYCILFNDLNYHININFQSNELDGNSAGLCWEYAFHSEIDVSKDPFIPKDKLNSNEFSILFHEAGHAIDQLCCLYDLTGCQTQAVNQCVDIFESNDIREKIDDISSSIEVPSHLFEFLSIEQSVIDFIQPCSAFLENIKERLLLLCLSHSLFSLKMHKMVQGHNITDIPHKTYYYYSIKLFFHQLIIFHSEVKEYRMSDYYFWGAWGAAKILKKHFPNEHKWLFN